MVKIFSFRGKSLEELQKMSLDELAKLLPARQRRTLKRGFTPDQKKLLERIRSKEKAIKTHVRSMMVLPEMVGRRLLIHNGKEWKAIDIKPEMIGYRLGDFALTRKTVRHSSPGVGATKGSKFMPLK
jgi:small subunit ribosomal protein S19